MTRGGADLKTNEGALFGEPFSALASSWRDRFPDDPRFACTLPRPSLAPRVSAHGGIQGRSTAVEVEAWSKVQALPEGIVAS